MAVLTKEFGAWNTAGEAPADIGVSGLTISSGDTSGHWQVTDSGGRALLSVSALGAGNLVSSYALGLSNGDTVNVTVTPNARVYDDLTDLGSAGESVGLAYGDQLIIRAGTYTTGFEITRTGYPAGSVVDPNVAEVTGGDGITRLSGQDFAGCNYVKIRPAAGDDVIVEDTCRFNDNGGFWVQNLTFRNIRLTENTGTPSGGGTILNTGSPGRIIYQGNRFICTDFDTIPANTPNRHLYASVGINYKSASSGCIHTYIADNYFENVYSSFRFTGAEEPLAIFGNVTDGTFADMFQNSGVPDNTICAWNELINYFKTTNSGHIDAWQHRETSAVTGTRLIGNRLGQGKLAEHATGSGNGVLVEGGGTVTDFRAYGNIIALRSNNNIGIALNDSTGEDIRFNTIVNWEDHTVNLMITGGAGTKNVTNNIGGDNTEVDAITGDYAATFIDPQTGSNQTRPLEAQYGIKPGSPAYIAGHGPQAASFNYSARVYSLTGADTSAEPDYDNGLGQLPAPPAVLPANRQVTFAVTVG